MCSLTRLRSLNLGHAGLQQWPIPPVPHAMPALSELVLHHNRELRGIGPQAFIACPALAKLDLCGVPGAGFLLPGTLAHLQRLSHLDLSQVRDVFRCTKGRGGEGLCEGVWGEEAA
jgi:hypothetical protein